MSKPSASSRAELFPLADYMCFAVYSTNLAFGKAYKTMLDQLGLTYTQYLTLIALAEQDMLTVSSLGEKLFLASNTLTPILKKLEAMGHVERQRDTQDERVVLVRVTKSGRKLRDRAVEMNASVAAMTGLTPDDFARVQKGIVALRDTLIESTGQDPEA
ncbi:MarR family transcriptional regulator [Paucibacter sp. R3-3]|uniref:MarR family transcriptional regulator n=1 Tax=Roseateles agri TaxID=3098619 RepID=A0ABU5DF87_9BURK|nr:MarR family transcriptional regulator [Paucibacter sp. R3-3]MDY0743939.1 MarR family transcriptional regulator [Paucibacter sp. R3-3]